MIILREHLSSSPVFWWVRVANIFNFLCCLILCLNVLNSLLWCPLRFPHKNDVRFVLTPVVCRRAHVLFTLFCVCLRIVVFNAYYVVFFILFFVVLCTLCCQFLWIVLSVFSNVYVDKSIKISYLGLKVQVFSFPFLNSAYQQ